MPLSGKELVKLLQKNGWCLDRIKGSHHILKKESVLIEISVPVHGNRSLGKGMEHKLLKKAGLKK